ncbi:MAG: hypothetical protein RLZZ347_303 [Candidatus Parcubacteria bacterium]|jgi:hypothetical protein
MGRSAKSAPVEPPERICDYPGCVTILSATNDDTKCRCHQSKIAKAFIAQFGADAESSGSVRSDGRHLTLRLTSRRQAFIKDRR